MKLEREQVKEIEFIFKQSVQGIHLLFDDTKKLTDILSQPTIEKTFFESENMSKIQELFYHLISKKSLKEKQNYLSSLNPKNFEILVRTYFHILENTVLNENRTVH